MVLLDNIFRAHKKREKKAPHMYSANKNSHIPTNGVVLGVEEDPTDGNIIRMFAEHRSRIIEDMMLCECAADRDATIVHQEAFDAGNHILYRVTIVHADHTKQSCVVRVKEDCLEYTRSGAAGHWAVSPRTSHIDYPSPRFPISPALSRHILPEENKILVYTSVSYDADKAIKRQNEILAKEHTGRRSAQEARNENNKSEEESNGPSAVWSPCYTPQDGGSLGDLGGANHEEHREDPADRKLYLLSKRSSTISSRNSDSGDAKPTFNLSHVVSSDNEELVDDFRSLMKSEESFCIDDDTVHTKLESPRGLISGGVVCTKVDVPKRDTVWRRPFIESAVVCSIAEPPFECFPRSIT